MIRGFQNRRILKTLVWMIMANVMFVIANQAMFIHAHRMSDGTIVVHAHPFKSAGEANEPYQSHKHTSYDYLLLDNFTHFLVTFFTLILMLITIRAENHFKKVFDIIYQADVVHPSLRAPPASH
jgi:hypothetical protein